MSDVQYRNNASAWYERWGDGTCPLAVAWHNVHCACGQCLQADFNAYFVHGLPLEVRGL